MGWKKQLLRLLLAVLILFDLGMLKEYYLHGRPVSMSGKPLGDGRTEINVTRLPLTAVDWMICTLLVCAHVILIYGSFRTRRPSQHHREARKLARKLPN